MPIQLLSPAKTNLYLRVCGRRPDGYHELQTLFQRIDLCDSVIMDEIANGIEFFCSEPSLQTEDNLVVRAANAIRKEGNSKRGVRIHLKKNIPIAAGLGGGSSNAAIALVGLNRLWGLELSRDRLEAIARKLGADVPFFLLDAAYAFAEGAGDECRVFDCERVLHGVLVNPGIQLSTREVFEGGNFSLTAQNPSVSLLQNSLCNGSLSELAQGMVNDLEPEAIRRCPIISDIQTRLQKAGCLVNRVSGSGPTVFGLCHSRHDAEQVVKAFRSSAWFVVSFSTLIDSIFP